MIQINLDSIHIHVNEIPPTLTDKDVCYLDTEFFGQDTNRLHRPHGQFAALQATVDGVNVFIATSAELIQQFMNAVAPATHVWHNAMYDITQLRGLGIDYPDRKNIWDTMLVEQVRWSGYYSRFALNDLFRRYCDGYLPKTERASFKKKKVEFVELTAEQLQYSAADVVALKMVYEKQSSAIDKTDRKIWERIELPFMWTLLDTGGITVDVARWMAIADEKDELSTELFDKIQAEYGVNVRSPKQLLTLLQSLNIRVESTGKVELEKVKSKHPIVETILKYRKPAKGASTYGKKWLSDWVEQDGMVHCSYKQIGTVTGRLSSAHPNMQNIPTREDARYRECFIAGEGNTLIIADYASQEPRITAFFSQDDALMQIFVDGGDIYCDVGEHVFGEKFDKKDKRRKDMKALVLGLSYGMTKVGLAQKIENTEEYAQNLIDTFFEKFPGVKKYIDRQIAAAKHSGFVTTIYGRKIWISPYASGLERDAPNYPIQASAADATKLASSFFRREWKEKHGVNPIRLYVHDEIVIETPEALAVEAEECLKRNMETIAGSMHKGIPSIADLHVGKSWAEKG